MALISALLIAVGPDRVVADGTESADVAESADEVETAVADVDHSDSVDLFDDSVAHTIALDTDQADLAAAIATYDETGDKEYFSTDITSDGIAIDDVGVRIKGNSTLRAVLQGDALSRTTGISVSDPSTFPSRCASLVYRLPLQADLCNTAPGSWRRYMTGP